jgi:hypothetical protein
LTSSSRIAYRSGGPARMTRDPRPSIVCLTLLLLALAWPAVAGAGESLPLSRPPFAWPVSGAALTTASLTAASPAAESPLDASDGEASTMWRVEDPLPALRLASMQDPARGGAAAPTAAEQEQHWSRLPFLGELAREQGYTLPLPFGVTAAYNYIGRDIKINDVRVGLNGAPLRSVTEVANFKARSTVDAAVIKTDVWLLPFLNVYLLIGYIDNVAKTNIEVTVDRPGPLPGTRQFRITKTTELQAFVGGGGVTLAAGFKQLFVMADVNYTQTDLGFDDRFHALIASARAGWNGQVGPVPLRLWLGAAYWSTRNTARATVSVPDVGAVRFEADQGPRHPWNAVVGVSSALHRRFELFAEYGFGPSDVVFFAGGLTFRF